MVPTDHPHSLRLRRRVRRRSLELDWSLAGGAGPEESAEHKLRSEELLLGQEQLARSLDRVVAAVDDEFTRTVRPRDGIKPRRAPLRREKVWACRPLLVELSERLRAARPRRLRALATAAVLIRDRSGPLYDTDRSRRLQRTLQATLSLFEEERAFVRR